MKRRWPAITLLATLGVLALTIGMLQGSAFGGTGLLKVASVTPKKAEVGTVVAIKGSNLLGATAVKFNGITAVFTVDSNKLIHATVPTGATTGVITVLTKTQTATSAHPFAVLFDVSFMGCLTSGKATVPVGTEPTLGVGWTMADKSYMKPFRKSTVTTLAVNDAAAKKMSAAWDRKGDFAAPNKWVTYWGYDTKTVFATGSTMTLVFHVTVTKEFTDGFATYKPGAELFPGPTCVLNAV